MTKPIPIDEADLRAQWAAGTLLRVLAIRYGCTKNVVSQRAQRLGLPKRLRSSGERPQRAMVRAYLNGSTVNEIAEVVGCSHSTVGRILRMHGVELRGRSGRADKSWLALAGECVKLVLAGFTHAQIGRRLGLTRAQVLHRVHRIIAPKPYRKRECPKHGCARRVKRSD